MIYIEIQTENDAFAGPEGESPEVVRILRQLANSLERDGGIRFRVLHDINGTTVGFIDQAQEA